MWAIVETAEIVHILPVADEHDHHLFAWCQCQPVIEDQLYCVVFKHRAYDEREKDEYRINHSCRSRKDC